MGLNTCTELQRLNATTVAKLLILSLKVVTVIVVYLLEKQNEYFRISQVVLRMKTHNMSSVRREPTFGAAYKKLYLLEEF